MDVKYFRKTQPKPPTYVVVTIFSKEAEAIVKGDRATILRLRDHISRAMNYEPEDE